MNFLSSIFRPNGRDQVHDPEKDVASGHNSPNPPISTLAQRATVLEPEDLQQLNTFRHMVGIHSTKGFITQIMGTENVHDGLHFDGRTAPNLGIVRRDVHVYERSRED
jgi:hypothetical protein